MFCSIYSVWDTDGFWLCSFPVNGGGKGQSMPVTATCRILLNLLV